MKKVLFSAIALALLATSSCKKDDDNNGPGNSWTLNGTQYNTTTTNYAFDILGAFSTSPQGTLSVDFASAPGAGDYTVSGSTASNTTSVGITASASSTAYTASEHNTNKANVTLNGGKITIKFTDIWMISASNANDSVKLSGNIIQQ